jgi:hypothetical protein
MSDKPGILKRLRGGFDPRESQRRSVEARMRNKAARARAAELELEQDPGVRVPDDVPQRRPFQSWRAFYDERESAPSERARTDTWQGRPLSRAPDPGTPDKLLSPGQWDKRRGVRPVHRVRRRAQWYDRRAGVGVQVLSPAQIRGEDLSF